MYPAPGKIEMKKSSMRQTIILVAAASIALFLLFTSSGWSAPDEPTEEPFAPHTPTLIFYLSGMQTQQDADAIRASVKKLKSASLVTANTNRSYVRIRFDSHIVSYHQVAQTISDAGVAASKQYNPRLVFIVPGYSQGTNAAKVDAIFAGKRLNTRVTVKPLNKTKGQFLISFLPLKVAPKTTAPQGFNGGHLHHPISDPVPRGLALPSSYATDDDPAIPVNPK
jgi:copper chaperone CopZ